MGGFALLCAFAEFCSIFCGGSVRRSFFFLVFTLFSLVLIGCSGNGSSGPKTTTPISPANNPVPTVNAISPTNVPAGSPALTVTFTGTGYITATTATLNGVSVQANYVSATSLQATVPAAALAGGQVADFVLSNPSPGGVPLQQRSSRS
jgi:hypothetical protein